MKPATVICVVLAVLPLALFASACGDDEGTETVTETVGETTATAAPTAPAEETLEAGEGDEGPQAFSTPSQNIGCIIDAEQARCDIAERSWKPTPEPASCKQTGGDYGQGIVLDAAGAEFVCAGDTTLGAAATLEYGEAAQRGALRCESAEDGVTCTDVDDGHGFFISRQSYRIF